MGSDSEQVIGSIMIESVIIGLFASVAGLFGGIGLALGLKSLLSAIGFALPSGGVVILARTVIVSIAGGMTVTVVSAIAPAVRAARVPPLAAVRSITISTVGQRRFRRLGGGALFAMGVAATSLGAYSVAVIWLGIGAAATVLGVAMLAPSITR